MDIYLFVSYGLFFLLYFGFTQKIYSRNYFVITFLISLLPPIVFYFQVNDRSELTKRLLILSITFIFIILLFIVKLTYKRINQFLISKNLVKQQFAQKDFTYVFIGDFDEWWNEKLALAPSRLDYLITILLLLLPILLPIFFIRMIN